MPRRRELHALLRRWVRAEVKAMLAPQLKLVRRFDRLHRSGKLEAMLKGATRTTRRAAEELSRFVDGQRVKYRQGRGEFEAVVMLVDNERGVLVLQRLEDRKTVERPPSKVSPA